MSGTVGSVVHLQHTQCLSDTHPLYTKCEKNLLTDFGRIPFTKKGGWVCVCGGEDGEGGTKHMAACTVALCATRSKPVGRLKLEMKLTKLSPALPSLRSPGLSHPKLIS